MPRDHRLYLEDILRAAQSIEEYLMAVWKAERNGVQEHKNS